MQMLPKPIGLDITGQNETGPIQGSVIRCEARVRAMMANAVGQNMPTSQRLRNFAERMGALSEQISKRLAKRLVLNRIVVEGAENGRSRNGESAFDPGCFYRTFINLAKRRLRDGIFTNPQIENR